MRKTQEQRRHDTKKAVLSAAVKVLGETGYSKFSSGRVAVRAGVSRGALEHYYPTKEALLIAVCQYVIDEGVTEAKRLANRDATFADPVERFLLDSEHYFFSSTYRAMIELAIAIDGNAKLTRLYHDVLMRGRAELNKVWLDALMAAGVPAANAELFIDLTHHFFRGLFLVSAWLPYKPNRPALLRAWAAIAPTVLSLKDPSVQAHLNAAKEESGLPAPRKPAKKKQA